MIERFRRITEISSEVFRYQRFRGLSTISKALMARGIWGVEIEAFLMQGLEDRPMRAWRESIGYFSELEEGLRTINWRRGKQLTVDKLATAERLAEAALPGPDIIAVVGRKAERFPHKGIFPAFGTVSELLPSLAGWPTELFIKPATGWRGEGIFGASRLNDAWVDGNRRMSDREFAELLFTSAPPAGLLVQGRLRSHPALEPIGGQFGLETLRINTALTSSGPRILIGFVKIIGYECLVDNFSSGKFGNMLGKVDPESGELQEVYGRPNGERYLMAKIQHHPMTGAKMIGFRIPYWDEAIELAKSVTSAFPEAPLIAMDIAITAEGPLVIEVQSDWAPNIAQRFLGQGLKPILADLVPRLPIDGDLKVEATEKLGLHKWRARRTRASLPAREDAAD